MGKNKDCLYPEDDDVTFLNDLLVGIGQNLYIFNGIELGIIILHPNIQSIENNKWTV